MKAHWTWSVNPYNLLSLYIDQNTNKKTEPDRQSMDAISWIKLIIVESEDINIRSRYNSCNGTRNFGTLEGMVKSPSLATFQVSYNSSNIEVKSRDKWVENNEYPFKYQQCAYNYQILFWNSHVSCRSNDTYFGYACVCQPFQSLALSPHLLVESLFFFRPTLNRCIKTEKLWSVLPSNSPNLT